MAAADLKSALKSPEAQLLGLMIETVKADVERVEETVKEINQKMEVLTRIDERLGALADRVTKAESDHAALEARVASMEEHMPGLKEKAGWLVSAVLLVCFLVAVGGITYVLHGKSERLDSAETASHLSEAGTAHQ